MKRARADGRGVVFALPHSGNWDAAGVWLVNFLGGHFMTVVERLLPESLYRQFLAYRETLGMRVVPLTGGPRPSLAVLGEWLDGGGWVCLLVDRDLGAGGVPVDLFGRRATIPGGPGLLAARTGAALHRAICRLTGRGWAFDVPHEVAVEGPRRRPRQEARALQGGD